MIYIVWEGLVALPTDDFTQAKYDWRLRVHRTNHALKLYEPDPTTYGALWEIWDRQKRAVIVSYLSPAIKPALMKWLSDHDVPHTSVIISRPRDMARTVGIHPEIKRIIDPNPAHKLLYGPKGMHLTPSCAHLIGKVI